MKKESLDFLKELADVISPSGFEADAARLWRSRVGKFSDEVNPDVNGNSIAVLNNGKKPKIMLAGHIDEIGYMVKYIDKEGYIYFSTIGGIDAGLIPGQRVYIKTKKGRVLGVIGKKPIHLLQAEEKKKLPKIEELWIDIGAKSEKESKEIVSIGDPAVPAVGFDVLKNNRVVGRGFDDKAGAFVVNEAIRIVSEEKGVDASVYGVATVQEEIGLRGARTSAYGVSPDIGIAVDATFAADFPGMDKKKIGDIKLGAGPVIARGPNINSKVFEILLDTAKDESIPYQIEAISKATGTDANVIQLTKAGVVTGLVSIPLRYMHTPVEIVDLEDLVNASKLLAGFILRINEKMSFMVE